jgi:hypothetical protein
VRARKMDELARYFRLARATSAARLRVIQETVLVVP